MSTVAAQVRRSFETDLGGIGAFLPARVPADDLPPVFQPYLAACSELASRYPRGGGGVRAWLDRSFRDDAPCVRHAIPDLDVAEADALMTALAVLGHTYRWDTVPPSPERFSERSIELPPGIVGPWGQLAASLDQPRVGSAWSLHLTNWRMTGRSGDGSYRAEELSRSPIRMAHTWLGPPLDAQLECFSLAFVRMEALGAAVLSALVDTVDGVAAGAEDAVIAALDRVRLATLDMTLGLSRDVRPRTVDPAIWLEVIQPTFAWGAAADDPARIDGGPSGMQLGTVQALDATFGVGGRSDMARLGAAARLNMPRRHRRFLGTLDGAGPVLRAFVIGARTPELSARFDGCILALARLRVTHRARGAQYLRCRPVDGAPRASTGLSIGVDDDPIATFERSMDDRIDETYAAMLRPDHHRELGHTAPSGP